jgi:outer membrane murein-binding lipoprotein Lpp
MRAGQQQVGHHENRDLVICGICFVFCWSIFNGVKDEMKEALAQVGEKIDTVSAKVQSLDAKVQSLNDDANSELKSIHAEFKSIHASISEVRSDMKESDKELKDELMQFINDRFIEFQGYLNSRVLGPLLDLTTQNVPSVGSMWEPSFAKWDRRYCSTTWRGRISGFCFPNA